MRTHDCEPTLNDSEVLEFCKQGFLLLPEVVSEEVNARSIEYVEARPGIEPSEILLEDWFLDGVILNPAAAGAVRSLLGKDFGVPILMSSHRADCPMPAQEWHTDGGSVYGPELHYLQVFYLPQDSPRDLGPTELLPGSHFLYSHRDYMRHLGRIKGSVYAEAPAGSILITNYAIWHRRSESTGTGVRHNLKYNYFRTAPPERDWVVEPSFDLVSADYRTPAPTYRQQFRDCYDAAEMLFWMRGEHEKYGSIGGQGWPMPGHRIDKPFGIPSGL